MLTLHIDNQTLEFQREFLYHNAQLPWERLHRESGMSRFLAQAVGELQRERMAVLRAEGQTVTLFGIAYEDVRASATCTGNGSPCGINTPQGQVHITIFATRRGSPREGLSPAASSRLLMAWEQEAAAYYRENFERLRRQAAWRFLEETESKLATLAGRIGGMRDVLGHLAWQWGYSPAAGAKEHIGNSI